jgi:hypothetical protein
VPVGRSLDLIPLAAGCAGALFALVVLAVTFHRLWAGVGHGLDITDEGLYLRSADALGPDYAYAGFSGAYLHPVFRLAGYNVATLRALGIILLSGAALVLSCGLRRALAGSLTVAPGDSRFLGLLTRICLHIAVVSGAVTYYSLFLVTPSYNWLTLVGTLLAGGGVLALLAPERGTRWDLADPALFGCGCFLALMGRPTAGVGLWVIGVTMVLATSTRPFRRRLFALGVLITVTLALGVFHLLFVTGWSDSLDIARRTAYMAQNDVGGHDLRSLRAATVRQLGLIRPGVSAQVGALPLLGLSVLLARVAPARHRAVVAGLLGSASVAVVALRIWREGGFGGAHTATLKLPFAGFALLFTAAAVFAAAVALQLLPGSETARRDVLVRSWRVLTAGAFFVLAAGLYAFSSNNGIVGQLWGGFGILAVAALVLVTGGLGPAALPVTAATMAAVCSVAAFSTISRGAVAPYRMAPMAESTVRTQVSDRGATLKVSPETAAALTSLRAQALAGGWRAGLPLVDLTPFTPGVGYLLGARPPTTILLGRAPKVMRWALERQDRAVFHDAWLLIHPGVTTPEQLGVVDVLGRSFPHDYERVAAISYPFGPYPLELWRPRTR